MPYQGNLQLNNLAAATNYHKMKGVTTNILLIVTLRLCPIYQLYTYCSTLSTTLPPGAEIWGFFLNLFIRSNTTRVTFPDSDPSHNHSTSLVPRRGPSLSDSLKAPGSPARPHASDKMSNNQPAFQISSISLEMILVSEISQLLP